MRALGVLVLLLAGGAQAQDDDFLEPIVPVRKSKPKPAAKKAPPAALVRLRVEGEPEQLRVLIDGKPAQGDVGWLFTVEPGLHLVQVERDGYRGFASQVTARPGKTAEVLVTLSPLPAKLRVGSVPPGADVYIDGLLMGVAPLEDVPLPPGRVVVELKLEGFTDHREELDARPGGTHEVHPALSAVAPTPVAKAPHAADAPVARSLSPKAPAASPVVLRDEPTSAPAWYKRWYVWAGVGAALLVGGVVVATQVGPAPPVFDPHGQCGPGGCDDCFGRDCGPRPSFSP